MDLCHDSIIVAYSHHALQNIVSLLESYSHTLHTFIALTEFMGAHITERFAEQS